MEGVILNMANKRVFKLATASAVAASALVAAVPASAASVTYEQAEKQVNKAREAANGLHALYTRDADYVTQVDSKEARDELARAKAKIAALSSAKEKAYLSSRIQGTIDTVARANAYNNAVRAGGFLGDAAEEVNAALANGVEDLAAAQTAQDKLNLYYKVSQENFGKVYGKEIQANFKKEYITADLVAFKANAYYGIATRSHLVEADKAIKDNNVADAEKYLGYAKASVAKVTVEGLKDALTASWTKLSADLEAIKVPKVESVSAINAKELVIKFNKAVDSASVIAAGNLKAGVFEINNAEANGLTSSASLSADGKTLTLASTTSWNGTYSVELLANQAVALDGKKVSEYTGFFTASDSVRASVTGVTYVDQFTYDINFSEPVSSTGTIAYSYADGTSTPITVTSETPSTDGKSVRVVFNGATIANKQINIALPSITDYAGNISVPTNTNVTISNADQSKPVISSITTTGYNGTDTSFQIKLSEAVKGSTVSGITVNGAAVTATVDANDKTLINATVTGKVKGSLLVYVPAAAFTDLNNNANAEVGQFYTFTQDEVAPTLASQSIERIAGVEYLVLTFNENVNTVSSPASVDFKSVDQYGMTTTTTLTPAVVKHDVVDGKTKKVRLSLAGLADNKSYKVTFASGLVKDGYNNSSAQLTDVAFATSTVNTGVGTDNVATIGATPATPGKVTINFSKPVNVASAQNVANYGVEGATVASATVTSNNSSGATVELMLTDGTVETSGNYNVTVRPIAAFNSLDTANVTTTASVLLKENVRALLSSSVLSGFTADSFTLNLTFNDSTLADGVADDFELYVNGQATGETFTVGALTSGGVALTWTDSGSVSDLTTATSVKLVALDTLDIADTNGNKAKVSEIVIK